MSEPHTHNVTMSNVTMSELHTYNSTVSEPHTHNVTVSNVHICNVTVSELHTDNTEQLQPNPRCTIAISKHISFFT